MIGYLFVLVHVVAAFKFGTDNNDVGLWMAIVSGAINGFMLYVLKHNFAPGEDAPVPTLINQVTALVGVVLLIWSFVA